MNAPHFGHLLMFAPLRRVGSSLLWLAHCEECNEDWLERAEMIET